jgi:hypothetical protein
MKRILAAVLLLEWWSVGVLEAQSLSAEITADDLTTHTKYLASDALEGRGSGTEGNRKAAQYLAEHFRLFDLRPAGDSATYFQHFDFVSAVKLGAANSFVATPRKGKPRSLKVDQDFRPLGFSSNTKVSGSVAFVGYGIVAPEQNYDDYTGIDVTGKIVAVLRYGPDGADMHSAFYKHAAYREKARIARDKGALAMILVDGTEDELLKLRYDQSFATSGIPCVAMQRSVLQSWLSLRKKDLKWIQDYIKEKKAPVNFELPVKVTIETEVVKAMGRTANVVGYLEGNDPALREEVVVVGAHFDHLGYGGEGSGSMKPDAHEIHNGADDNASGTSGLLELAQKFSTERSSLTRSMIFIGFSAEEIGTIGSQYYVNHPSVPLAKTVAMLNLDMVGRLKENTLTVSGVGTSPMWNDLVRKHNVGPDTLTIKTSPEGFGPSDHAQFYAKDIPVLFFFTGTHGDYHKPSDDWDKLNYEGTQRVAKYVYAIARDLQSKTERPQFTKAAAPTSTAMGGGNGRGFSVTLGVVPDYGATVEGMKIDGTRAGGPAEKAGLLAGDVITKLAGKKVLNIYDYMGILGGLKVGDVVEIEALRDGKTMKFSATLQKR